MPGQRHGVDLAIDMLTHELRKEQTALRDAGVDAFRTGDAGAAVAAANRWRSLEDMVALVRSIREIWDTLDSQARQSMSSGFGYAVGESGQTSLEGALPASVVRTEPDTAKARIVVKDDNAPMSPDSPVNGAVFVELAGMQLEVNHLRKSVLPGTSDVFSVTFQKLAEFAQSEGELPVFWQRDSGDNLVPDRSRYRNDNSHLKTAYRQLENALYRIAVRTGKLRCDIAGLAPGPDSQQTGP